MIVLLPRGELGGFIIDFGLVDAVHTATIIDKRYLKCLKLVGKPGCLESLNIYS